MKLPVPKCKPTSGIHPSPTPILNRLIHLPDLQHHPQVIPSVSSIPPPNIHMTMSIPRSPPSLRLRQTQLHPQCISLSLHHLLHSPRLGSLLLSTIRTITVDPPGIVLLEFGAPFVAAEWVCAGDEAFFVFAAFGVWDVFGPAAAGAFVVVEPAHYVSGWIRILGL